MKYLLDVSALVALGVIDHEFHARAAVDGHLVQLAGANGAVLATLDERIPGAYLIPHDAPRSRLIPRAL